MSFPRKRGPSRRASARRMTLTLADARYWVPAFAGMTLGFGELQNPAAVTAAEIVRDGIRREHNVLVQVAFVVDIGERIDAHVGGERQKRRDGEDAVGVEFDALRTDRHGEIELAAFRKHTFQIGEPFQMALEIDRVAVAAEAEML